MVKKLLYIEDNLQEISLFRDQLLARGVSVEVDGTATGEDGVARAKVIKPDIIVIDTCLPGIDGFEVCAQIRKIKDLDAKIVITTGVVDAVNAQKAREAGADDYCVKTVGFEGLVDSVKNFVK